MPLPAELWYTIAGHLTQKDIVQLSHTNSRACTILRPLCYRRVFLTATSIDVTFALLARDESLAAVVAELSLFGLDSEQPPLLINLAAMKNLTGLRKLEIVNDVFGTNEKTAAAFFDAVCNLASLEELSITMASSSGYKGQLGKIIGLKTIKWSSPSSLDTIELLRSLLSASRISIQTLYLTIHTFSLEVQTRIFDLRFPSLQSLTLRDRSATKPLREGFTQFIVAHDNITHLDLGYTTTRSSCLSFTEEALINFRANPHATLPRLQSFCGDTTSFRVLARAGLPCLSTTLTRIDIGPSALRSKVTLFELFAQTAHMFDAAQYLPIHGRFGALKEFGLYLGDFRGPVVVALGLDLSLLVTFTATFLCQPGEESGIEVWRRPFPFVDTSALVSATSVGMLFRVMKSLKVVYLEYQLVVEAQPAVTSEVWVKAFIAACEGGMVRTVHFCDLVGDVVESWRVEREGGGEVPSFHLDFRASN
ncbi:hypothetical protein V5O48_018674 [Marasmius crinis-equi]|uniref:F-box domain-containing protein n=1 Tax=Marasmius crinis-equi TaxID=585013 RepID=A0ABR3EKH1_9AGAR